MEPETSNSSKQMLEIDRRAHAITATREHNEPLKGNDVADTAFSSWHASQEEKIYIYSHLSEQVAIENDGNLVMWRMVSNKKEDTFLRHSNVFFFSISTFELENVHNSVRDFAMEQKHAARANVYTST